MEAEADEWHHSPAEPQTVPVKSFDLQTYKVVVSALVSVSESEAVDEKVILEPRPAESGEVEIAVKDGI